MKYFTLSVTLFLSLSAFGQNEMLSFQGPDLKVNQVVLHKPIQFNLIRLYQKLPSEKRMIAGYLNNLRDKLKTTNGKIRI